MAANGSSQSDRRACSFYAATLALLYNADWSGFKARNLGLIVHSIDVGTTGIVCTYEHLSSISLYLEYILTEFKAWMQQQVPLRIQCGSQKITEKKP